MTVHTSHLVISQDCASRPQARTRLQWLRCYATPQFPGPDTSVARRLRQASSCTVYQGPPPPFTDLPSPATPDYGIPARSRRSSRQTRSRALPRRRWRSPQRSGDYVISGKSRTVRVPVALESKLRFRQCSGANEPEIEPEVLLLWKLC